MDFKELVQKRRACHNFVPGFKIPKADLEEMIELTRLSPSGYNAQPWEFIIIQENLEKLQEIAFDQAHVQHASAIIIVLGDLEIGRNVDQLLKDWQEAGYWSEEDLPAQRNSIAKNRSPRKKEIMALRNSSLAAMTLIYAAENLGYSTCPMMGLKHTELIEHLGIPEDRMVTLMIALGKAATEEPPRLPRKSLDQLIHWERF